MSPSQSATSSEEQLSLPVAVYCGACLGTESAFESAAASLGRALSVHGRPLVYGGGTRGMMGTVSNAVLQHGGSVTAVIPSAIFVAGGEGEFTTGRYIELEGQGREKVEFIVVESMHERKVEMARRVCGFIGLPGGYGTFEEIMEVTTWTQLGIHSKPVVLVNVLGFFDPLRALIKNAVASGFIPARNERLIIFVDAPPEVNPMTFNWGAAALAALDCWSSPGPGFFTWKASAPNGDSMAEFS